MKFVSICAISGLAALLSLPQPASAGRRITCTCHGKTKTWIHHSNACEYYFKKPFAKAKSNGSRHPVTTCTDQEYTRFHTELCAKDGCTLKD